MDSDDIDKDDSSSIRYIPHQVDYMRDYFRPKQFVKESKSNQDNSTKELIVKENDKQIMYTSIYDGFVVKWYYLVILLSGSRCHV